MVYGVLEMARKKTAEQFITEAIAKHGDKYDYSKTVYGGDTSTIIIMCPTHGEFTKVAKVHLMGYGCKKCNSEKNKMPLDEVVNRFKSVHGDKYDYSKVVYVNSNVPVTIICKKHGDFEQKPVGHYNQKHGCPKCALDRRSEFRSFTTEEAIARFKAIHGDRYDYSKVEYKKSEDKICINCPDHGDFWQVANSHAQGIGCAECSNKKPLTQNEVLKRFRDAHGDRYLYDKVDFKNNKEKVVITCRTHGDFEQVSRSHWVGHGCQKCMGITISRQSKHTQDQVIKDFIAVHGKKYDYSKVKYEKSGVEVCIICPSHGEFWQDPMQHKTGRGCIHCGNKNHHRRSLWQEVCSRPRKKPCFYILKCSGNGEEFYKVGITSRKIRERYSNEKQMPYEYKIEFLHYADAGFIWDLEKSVHGILRKFHVVPSIYFGGHFTECFSEIPKEVLKLLDNISQSNQLQLIA